MIMAGYISGSRVPKRSFIALMQKQVRKSGTRKQDGHGDLPLFRMVWYLFHALMVMSWHSMQITDI